MRYHITDNVIYVMNISGYWDCSSFQHSYPSFHPHKDIDKILIYPTLYPVAEKTWALALVSGRYESYSGGGSELFLVTTHQCPP